MKESDENENVKKEVQNGVLLESKYSLISKQTLNQKDNVIWNSGRVPYEGLNEITIMNILYQISSQNMCNSEKTVKIGERESRIYSAFIRSKYLGFGHGVGRSGNLEDAQPKSAGNAVLAKITTRMVKNLIKRFGIRSCEDVCILPYATGMCLSTCLLYLKNIRKESEYVILSRIDHKTIYKCIDFCNLSCFIVDMIYENDELYTDLHKIENLMKEYNTKVTCVMSITSSYAPRNSDDIIKISHLCKKYNIPHVINNAFGLQCNYLCKEIQKCYDTNGRIDFVIQSCDKNLLLPVNGGIIFSNNKINMKGLKNYYPGRVPIHAYIDIFITLLELGEKKIMELRLKRENNFIWLQNKIKLLCNKYNLSLIKNSKNKISMAINLNELYKYCDKENPRCINLLGSMLFYRNVTGHKVICSPLLIQQEALKKRDTIEISDSTEIKKTETQKDLINDNMSKEKNKETNIMNDILLLNKKNILKIGNKTFPFFGTSYDLYPYSYIAFSCVIGIDKTELQKFVDRLDDTIDYFIKKCQKKNKKEIKKEDAA
ncbi:O-phosphoseryl-tRNA(Sec) selenium transferase, putative [Hepatocystis sp. ex Piliocolobus tephrosceles]|nr:O-phosphoseryl-tRNA(Sec) selenium transferase, putative [Hepatocystis sp. ex Piliocolobus tephrosceles]